MRNRAANFLYSSQGTTARSSRVVVKQLVPSTSQRRPVLPIGFCTVSSQSFLSIIKNLKAEKCFQIKRLDIYQSYNFSNSNRHIYSLVLAWEEQGEMNVKQGYRNENHFILKYVMYSTDIIYYINIQGINKYSTKHKYIQQEKIKLVGAFSIS